jgi:acetyl esterase/lipase
LSLRSDRALQLMRRMGTAVPVPVPAGLTFDERTITTADGRQVPIVVYGQTERDQPTAALVWIHGGGMVLGTPAQGHELCGRFSRELDIVVVSVDYRLAPEHPFPAGLEDCAAALAWVRDEAASLGVDPARIAVGGDSAGGGLAASLAQHARDTGGPAICFQLLEYPMLDDRTTLRADDAGRGIFTWTAASNLYAWTAYLGHPPTRADAPLHAAPARTPDLAGLPPAWIGVGELDLFYEEDLDYAERLREAGVACELHIEPGAYHGADAIKSQAPSSVAFRSRMVAALGAGLSIPA